MITQVPAEGILKLKDWKDAKMYKIACECTDSTHDHVIWVESDNSNVTVTIYTTQQSVGWWKESLEHDYDIDNRFLSWVSRTYKDIWNSLITRIRITAEIWIRGSIKYESTICLSKQQALNYAETIKKSINDVTDL